MHVSSHGHLFVVLGVYGDVADALDDYDALRTLAHDGRIRLHDAAVVEHHPDGGVLITRHLEEETRAGAEGGAIGGLLAGAAIGLLFPASILASAVLGAMTGGGLGAVLGHLSRTFSRFEVAELGGLIDDHSVAVLAFLDDPAHAELAGVLGRASARVQKSVAASREDVDRLLREATGAG